MTTNIKVFALVCFMVLLTIVQTGCSLTYTPSDYKQFCMEFYYQKYYHRSDGGYVSFFERQLDNPRVTHWETWSGIPSYDGKLCPMSQPYARPDTPVASSDLEKYLKWSGKEALHYQERIALDDVWSRCYGDNFQASPRDNDIRTATGDYCYNYVKTNRQAILDIVPYNYEILTFRHTHWTNWRQQ